MTDVPRGRFVWYELLTTDPEAAHRFYADLLGWDGSVYEDLAEPYRMWARGEEQLAGVLRLPDDAAAQGAVPNWLVYIATPDVDNTLMKAADHGARTLKEAADIPTVGRFAVLADPQGAVFAVFRPDQPPEDKPFEPTVGDISWHELITTDHAAALAFYGELFGWERGEPHDMGAMGVYQLFGRHGRDLGGMFDKTPDMPMPPSWLIYITVADLDASLERVGALGGQVLNGPMSVPGGDRIAQCVDPQGAAFALHARSA